MVVEPGSRFKGNAKMIDSYELTFEDLQRVAIRTEEDIGHEPAIVFRLGDDDKTSPVFLGGHDNGKAVYYSMLVLVSQPPTMAIN